MRPLLLAKLYPYVFKDPRSKNTLMNFFKAGITDAQNPFFSHLIRWNNTSRIKKFFSEELNSQLKDNNVFLNVLDLLPEEFNEWDYLAKAQYLEINIFMSNYLLSSQGDRMAMANSVEIRVPFLDHRLIELMAMVNPEYKIYLLNEKFILKKVFKNKLPPGIINRSKNPYRAPIKKGLLNSDSKLIENYLTEPEVKKMGLFNFNKINLFLKKLNDSDNAISETDAMTLTGLLSSQIVYDKFINSFNANYPEDRHFDKVFDYRNSEVIKE